jgi:hypothetical protein
MPMRRTAAPRTTRTTRAKPSLKTRLLGPKRTIRHTPTTTTTTTTTTRTTRSSGHHAAAAPVHHHKRHATMGDKVSGALMKLKGSLTHRPGVKVSLARLPQSLTQLLTSRRLLEPVACTVLMGGMLVVSFRKNPKDPGEGRAHYGGSNRATPGCTLRRTI